MTVNLYAADGTTLLQTDTTDSDGYYSFLGLDSGTTYVVEFVKAADESFTTMDVTVNPDDTKDSDADPVDGRVTVVAPADGANLATVKADGTFADDPTIDAGIVKYNLILEKTLTTAGPYRPGQTVTYTLVPKNEGPATAMAGWSVTDILPAGLTLVSMNGTGYNCTTTAGTCVSWTALAGGSAAAPVPGETITVTATIDASATGTLKNVAYVDKSANDTRETVPLIKPTLTTDTSQPDTDNDDEAQLALLPYVSVGDYVWYDHNRDGLQTSGEPAYGGMTVELYAAGATIGVDAPLKTDVTDAAGYYSFTDLDPNTGYVIRFVKVDTESFTKTNAGDDATNSPTADLTDSDAAQADGTVSFTTTATGVNSGDPMKADNPGIDAGVVTYNLVLDKAITSSGPYYEGGTATYTITPRNAGPSEALPGWTVTDLLPAGLTVDSYTATGYTCSTDAAKTTLTCTSTATTNFAVGSGPVITVVAKIGANVTGDLKNVAFVDKAGNDVPETNPLGTPPTTSTDTSQTTTDNDDQELITVLSLVSIGDFVWYDVNRDGVQDPTEAGAKAVTVTLTDAAGGTRTTTTDGNGYYWFDDLTPGASYTLTFTKPSGFAWTVQDAGGDTSDKDAGTDSDVLPATGVVSFTAPTSGTNGTGAPDLTDNPTIEAGLVEFLPKPLE